MTAIFLDLASIAELLAIDPANEQQHQARDEAKSRLLQLQVMEEEDHR